MEKTNSMPDNGAKQNESVKRIITVIASLLIQLCVGILYLWSIFNKSIQIELNLSEGSANLVSSFMMMGFVLGNWIGGYLQDRTGPRIISIIGCGAFCLGIICTSFLTPSVGGLIFLTYSGLGGIGCGFVYASILSCLQKWFPTKRGFASGLTVAAFGLSTVLFAPVAQALLKSFSARTTLLILGLTFLTVTAVCCIFIRLPKSQADKRILTGLTPVQTLRQIPFWCIALTCFFFNATWNILIPIIKPLGEQREVASVALGLIIMTVGIFNVSGRFGMASLSDKIGREITVIISTIITFICAIALIWATGYVYFIAVVLAAFAFGGPAATLPALSTDTFGTKYSGTNYGMALLGLGFSSIFFTFISNLLKDSTGNYTASFIMAACTALIPLALMPLYMYLVKKKKAAANKEL